MPRKKKTNKNIEDMTQAELHAYSKNVLDTQEVKHRRAVLKNRERYRKWYNQNKERARETSRRNRAWERFEVRRYRELKRIIKDMNDESLLAVQLQSFVKNDEKEFKKWYYGNKKK